MKSLVTIKNIVALAVSSALANAVAFGQESPNVILILADDMGYSDIEQFGGEIETPNLQKIADNGIRFSQYYTSPMSAPARSMVLTGNTNQQAGVGGMWWYESTKDQEGYELNLADRTVTMAERFKDAGYETLMVGKWHLGDTPETSAVAKGFNQSFAFMGGGASHFNDMVPLGQREAYHTHYELNGQKTDVPEDFYSTTFYTDQVNEWIKETPKDVPVFAYIAYTAPHDPLQAPEDWVKKYEGKYDEGYAAVYDKRIERLKEKGIIDQNVELPILDLQKRWDSLTDDEKKREAKTMEIYAAMIAYMDHEIGEVIATLAETGRLDNTIIIFASDNGANSLDGLRYYSAGNMDMWQQYGLDNSFDNLGKKGSFISTGLNWSDVNDAPYGIYHKGTMSQGGINTAMLISAPMLPEDKKGTWSKNMIAAYDLAPTLYDLTEIELKAYEDKLPMYGVSHKQNLLTNDTTAVRTQFGAELHNQLVFIDGDWKIRKITKSIPVATDAEWALFNIKTDPAETQNKADEFTNLLANMIMKYDQFAKDTLIIEAKGQQIRKSGQ